MEDCVSRVEEDRLIYDALDILQKRFQDRTVLDSPESVRDYLTVWLTERERECFVALFLDTRHRVLEMKTMFSGTLDGATVYPREVVKEALRYNAGAVIFCHNHPSGVTEPSLADQAITRRLKEALGTVDIRVLDHFIVGGGDCVSMAERGMI
ncbi:MAG: DNA repair protein RadC [Xanthomonadales bacterium]|jgi:DNA repair protein RadC|nr:DNA repair protein RadC [Xanthomonadales bacterium]